MSKRDRAVSGALFGAACSAMLGGCALIYNYGNYGESSSGSGASGGTGGAPTSGSSGGAEAGGASVGGTGTGGSSTGGSSTGGSSTGGSGGCTPGVGGSPAGLGPVKWSALYSSPPGGSVDFSHSLAVSKDGEVYLTAEFHGEVIFGPDKLDSALDSMLVLAKLDGATGMPVWGRKVGERQVNGDKGKSFTAKLGIDTFVGSNPVMGGTVDGLIEISDNMFAASQGYPDVFLEKRNPSGGLSWGATAGQQDRQIGTSISVAPSGPIAMAGYYEQALSFGGKCTNLTAGNQPFRVFAGQWMSDGSCAWVRDFGNANPVLGTGVTIDPESRVTVVGTYHDTISFGAGYTLAGAATMPSTNAFVLRLDTDGSVLGADSRVVANTLGVLVATDQKGVIFMAYNIVSSPAGVMPITYSTVVERLGATGWTKQLDSMGGSVVVTAMDVDDAGHVLLAGTFSGTVGVAQNSTTTITSDDNKDAFVLSLDANMAGDVLAGAKIGGIGPQVPAAVRHDPTGGAVVLGLFATAIDFGCGTTPVVDGSDVFIVKYAP